MLKFIIRLDDACPNMNKEKWDKIEVILDKYNIKPIVGIIPDNKDLEFSYGNINEFWPDYVKRWENKKWVIAMHGLNHALSKNIRTEFKGKSLEEQRRIIKKGLLIMKKHDINPICFFAPAHTFDNNTIKVCLEFEQFKFISDGYAFFPYKKNGMLLLPSVFDTPHKISNSGIFTFVYHPNNMSENDFKYLEEFIIKYKENFEYDLNYILEKYKNRRRNIFDYILHSLIVIFRNVRKVLGEYNAK